jgi:hypothetical protein
MKEYYFTTNSFAILPNETLETHPTVYGKSLAYWLSYYIQQANPLHINHQLKSPCKLDYTQKCDSHIDLKHIIAEEMVPPLVVPEHKSWNIICQKKPYLVWVSCSNYDSKLSADLDKNVVHPDVLNQEITWHLSVNYKFGLCSFNNLSQNMKNDAEHRIELLSNFILSLLRDNGIATEEIIHHD